MSESTPLVNSADDEVERCDVWQLSSIEDTPKYLHFQDILSGYRVHFTLRLCFVSLFRVHNELLNVYTHLLGALAFIALYIWTYVEYLSVLNNRIHVVIITLYTVAVVWLLFCSASFHLFNCQSPSAYACTARLDYSGIGIVILTSQWATMSYSFACWHEAFLGFAVVLGVFSILAIVGPMFNAFHHPRFRIPRALMYCFLAVVFPIAWFLMLGFHYDNFGSRAIVTTFGYGMGLSYAGYGFGLAFYLSRFPERCSRGKFDNFGASHQIWHCGVLLGAGALFRSLVEIAINIGDTPCSELVGNWF